MGGFSSLNQNLTNLTITTPQGTTNHDNQRLLCTPAKWTDVLSFFLSNYLTHVATVVTHPGEAGISTALALASALLLPTAGVTRGLTAIVRRAKFAKSPLEVAARAGALCMVVRSDKWSFHDGDVVADAILRGPLVSDDVLLDKFQQTVIGLGERMITHMLKLPSFFALPRDALEKKLQDNMRLDPLWKSNEPAILRLYWPPWANTDLRFWRFYDTGESVVDRRRTVHGSYRLVDGYELAYVPPDAVVLPNVEKDCDESADAVSANYSLPKALVAIIQLLFAISTLFEASGAQIDHYGYAAYALTVTPYAVMSLVNLLGTALTPTYPALYIVQSDIMEEAKRRGADFDGVVGRLVNESPTIDNAAYDCFGVRVLFHSSAPTNRTNDVSTEHSATIRGSQNSRASNQNAKNEAGTMQVFSHIDVRTKLHWTATSKAKSCMKFIYDFDTKAYHDLVRYRSLEREGITKHLEGPGFQLKMAPRDLTSTAIFVPVCSNFRRRSPRSWTFNPISFNPISLVPRMRDVLTSKHEELPQQITDICSWTVSLASLAIYGGLSQFHNASSTLAQRVITMMWVAFGVIVGPTFANYVNVLTSYAADGWGKGASAENRAMSFWTTIVAYFMLPFYGAASVAGFIVVGKMIREWGTCIELY